MVMSKSTYKKITQGNKKRLNSLGKGRERMEAKEYEADRDQAIWNDGKKAGMKAVMEWVELNKAEPQYCVKRLDGTIDHVDSEVLWLDKYSWQVYKAIVEVEAVLNNRSQE